jgi:hypothetical protein
MAAPKTEAEWRAQPGPWAHLTKEQTDELIAVVVKAKLEAVDAVCRTLMIRAAENQPTVRAVASALDKVRMVIREQTKQ